MVADPIVAQLKADFVANGCYAQPEGLVRCAEKTAFGDILKVWDQYKDMLGVVGMASMTPTIQAGLDAAKVDVPACYNLATDAAAVQCNAGIVQKAKTLMPAAAPIVDGVVSKLFDPLVACAANPNMQGCVEGTIDSAFNAALALLAPASRLVDIDPSMIAMVVDPAVAQFKTDLKPCYGQPNFYHCGVNVTLAEVNNLWNTYGSMLGMIGAADMATTAQTFIDQANVNVPVCLAEPTDAALVTCMQGLITKAKTALPAGAALIDQIDNGVLKPVMACAAKADAASQEACTEGVIDAAVAAGEAML